MLESAETGWGLALILWLQSWRTPVIGGAALFFHVIGSEVMLIVALPLIYWCVDTRLGKRLAAFLLIVSWLNTTLKSALQRPRPYQASIAVDPVIRETTYGIPSGHAQNATVLGGLLANELHHRWITVAGVLYALLTGFSRMVLGVHYPQDILAGIALGLVALGLYAVLEPPIGGWVKDRSLVVQLLTVVIVSAAMLVIHPLIIPVTSPQWLSDIIPIAELLNSPARPAGVFLGAGIGMVLESRYLLYDWRGTWKQQIARLLIGVGGGVAIYFLLGTLKTLVSPLAASLIRFGALGFWLTYGAPWVFIAARLAGRAVRGDPYAEQ